MTQTLNPHRDPISSILQFNNKITSKHGDKVAFRYFDAKKNILEMTYSEFSYNSKRLGAAFNSVGLAGKRIAVVGESCPEWVMTYVATLCLGSVIIPLDKELDVDQLFSFLDISEADAIVFTKSFCAKFKDKILSSDSARIYIPIDCEDEELTENKNVILLSKLLEDGKRLVEDGFNFSEYEASDDMREMLFTSGTTGTSKCVMLSEKNVVACVNSACATVDFSVDDVLVSVLPLHHTYELAVMISALNLGATVCINDSLKYVLKNFKLFKPTGLILVPLFVNTMYKKIFDEAKKTGQLKKLKMGLKISSALGKVGIDVRKKLFGTVLEAFGGRLCKIVCGGAALNPEYADTFKKFGINIYEGYGITECSPLISVNPFSAPKRGSVGPTVPSCTAIIDGNTTNSKGFTEGEILVKGENVMLGYYKNPEATEEVFTEDGYFRTGDIGYMDNDGYIYITGRKKSVIVLENGKNVFPEEIEEYLSNIETIAESVVVGRRDGESVVLTAIVFPAFDKFEKGTDIDTIAASIKASVNTLNKKLPGFKQVRNIELRQTEFEKTTSRKIKRYLVK
ncbi:MAG: AMP-binding protein [Clostridia bacterium]|nr:AMP-binding protein [Clostridia bacterium]